MKYNLKTGAPLRHVDSVSLELAGIIYTGIQPKISMEPPKITEMYGKDALPDLMIGLSEMREYGYTWNEMMPLTQEKTLELFDHDLPVYLLHNDGSETTVEDRKQITEHKGIFGIEKSDWENERKLRSMQAELSDNDINKEAMMKS